MSFKKLALKVDVDTYEGMRDGVPNLLKLFKELDIKASFFVPFGPDESGKAVFRVFKKKGFLKKMFRTNPVKLYGFKTMLRGTLLPAPNIGSSFPDIAKSILDAGHDLGIHGHNHVLWQDHLLEMSPDEVRRQVEYGCSDFEKAVGGRPRSFAAPAWLCTPASLKALDEFRFDFASDTRGRSPFYPSMNGQDFKTLQIPSTLPTADEMLGQAGMNADGFHDHITRFAENSNLEAQVHTVHTEVEGTALFDPFARWLAALKMKEVSFEKLSSIARNLAPAKVPRCEIFLGELPGRAGAVACQKA